MARYYDPEYEQEITEEEIREQYNDFVEHERTDKTYEQFRDDNFTLIK